MTLAYENIPQSRPSKTGLVVFGVLLLIPVFFMGFGGAFALLFTLGAVASAGGPAMFGAVFIGIGIFFVALILAAWLGIDMIRARRWVRPVTVTLAGLAWITLLASIPMLAIQGSSVFGMNTTVITPTPAPIPVPAPVPTTGPAATTQFGTASNSSSLGTTVVTTPPPPAITVTSSAMTWWLLVSYGFMLLFYAGVPFIYWWYFRRPRTREILEAWQPTPAWTDRWPLPVFAVGVSAALFAVTSVLSGFGSIYAAAVSQAGTLWVSAFGQVVSATCLAAIAYLCIRHRYVLAWRLTMLYLAAVVVVVFLISFLFPSLQADASRAFAGNAAFTPPASHPLATAICVSLIYLTYGFILLRMRPTFFQAGPPALPVTGFAVGNPATPPSPTGMNPPTGF